MKLSNTLLFFSLCILFTSCVPDLKFEEPQPKNKKDLAQFPKKIQGDYSSTTDNVKLVISEDCIKLMIANDGKTSEKNLELVYGLPAFIEASNNKTISPKQIEKGLEQFNTESAIDEISLFEKSDSQKLRSYKDLYILNYLGTDGLWSIRTLELDNQVLIFERILATEEKINAIKEITDVNQFQNKKGYIVRSINPKRKELKKILDLESEISSIRFIKE